MEPIQQPVYLDEPLQILLWSIDEVVPIIGGLVIGMAISQAFICLLLGVAVTHFYRRFRDNHAASYLRHMVYRWGFYASDARTVVNPFIRNWTA